MGLDLRAEFVQRDIRLGFHGGTNDLLSHRQFAAYTARVRFRRAATRLAHAAHQFLHEGQTDGILVRGFGLAALTGFDIVDHTLAQILGIGSHALIFAQFAYIEKQGALNPR